MGEIRKAAEDGDRSFGVGKGGTHCIPRDRPSQIRLSQVDPAIEALFHPLYHLPLNPRKFPNHIPSHDVNDTGQVTTRAA